MQPLAQFDHERQQWRAAVKDKGRIVWKSAVTYHEYDEAELEAQNEWKELQHNKGRK